jgi:hypothetical protein
VSCFLFPFHLPLFSSLRPNVIRTVLLCHHKDMLAQGRNAAQSTNRFAFTSGAPGYAHPAPVAPQKINTSPQMSGVNGDFIGSARGKSVFRIASDESEQARLNTRGKDKRNPSPTNGRRKADESTVKAPITKKSKTNAAATKSDMDFSDEGSTMTLEEGGTMSKMTDDEKRKNFLERNRYVFQSLIVVYCGSLLTLLEPASLPTNAVKGGNNGLLNCRPRLSCSLRRAIP